MPLKVPGMCTAEPLAVADPAAVVVEASRTVGNATGLILI
jgi:hypothetical protein